jgi:phosphoglucomutase/phosphomannomutase
MVANGLRVYFLEDYRSTPELSFLVRYKGCWCGVMVTASHNPPSDNAVKVYWSTGGQVLPPHDEGIIERVMGVEDIVAADFEQAAADGRVVLCKDEVDAAFLKELRRHSYPGPRDVKIIYSPLHGVGASAVRPLLEADGFQDVEVFGPHEEPSGDFPNVPGHVSNPENAAVFDAIIERGREVGADLILATDPDCDRMGCAAPRSADPSGPWGTLNGNQIASLLAEFVLEQTSRAGQLSADQYLVKTLVTTEMVRRIGDAYGVKTYGDLQVGFKWIGGVMDERGPEKFLFGAEESHGYLVGQYARDKDGAVACMLMAEMAARVKAEGKSLHQQMDALYRRYGYHAERLMNLPVEGSEGMSRMEALMAGLRREPPRLLAGLAVAAVRDYSQATRTRADGRREPLAGPRCDLVFLDLGEQGNCVAVRPSGTEPKIKFYMFAYAPPERLADLQATKQRMAHRLEMLQADLRALADAV